MSKEIWLGPVLGNNRERLVARCAGYFSEGRTGNLLYIAASHPLLDLITDKLLDGRNAHGVWGEFPVYLFRGFVQRILSEAQPSAMPANEPSLTLGPPTRVPIDREDLPLRRSLISQIIRQLSAAGQLKAIKPLANREGCVNTIATLLGELQRAGKTAAEFQEAVEARELEIGIPNTRLQIPESKSAGKDTRKGVGKDTGKGAGKGAVAGPASQIDFDREVALIYAKYAASLERFALTDEDADQLRALQALRQTASEPGAQQMDSASLAQQDGGWLRQIDLLVLDGFFDFTPVQGEILRCLIPQIPNVIVNLNYDETNEEIFRPFGSTIDQLNSIAPFETRTNPECAPVSESLSNLRSKLFNVTTGESGESAADAGEGRVTLLECSDREVEVRSIAKEIKRLTLTEQYRISDIALVVRERAAYADTIVRVFADEAIPCNLDRRVEAPDIPAVRACGKLFQLLKEPPENVKNPKATDLAHLIKTDYFRLSGDALAQLARQFDTKYAHLLDDANENEKLRARLGIGRWRSDDLENVIAYVGSELRVNAWIDRALKVIQMFPSPEAAQTMIAGDEPEDAAVSAEDENASPEDGAVMDRRKKPAPIHPAAIAWAVLIMRQLQHLLAAVPDEGAVEDLRRGLLVLLDQLRFSKRVNKPFDRPAGAGDIPQAILDVRGRESLRRAVVAAVRSFKYAAGAITAESSASSTKHEVTFASFVDEVERCLDSQVLAVTAGTRDGLRVLEATDVRGLRFRAIFVAGMIEGGFPLRTSRDWLYPHEERVRLQQHGIFLEDISTDTLLKEEHYFYQAACRATDRLYLTRPLALNDGSETVASYYLEELKRALAPNTIEVRQIRNDPDTADLHEISTPAELGTVLIRQAEAESRHTDNKSPLLSTANLLLSAEQHEYLSASAVQRISIERERNSEWFGPHDGEITNNDLREMLARHFGAEHVYSASRLSTYGNCAFRFFGNRVLRIEPRSEAALDLQAIDAGKLLHDILRRFFEGHRDEYLPAHDRDELREELAATADKVFREHEDKVPPLNERIWKIDCEIRKLILDQVLLYELRLQEKTKARKVLPAYFELAFGRASQASDPSSTANFLRLRRSRDAAIDVALIQGQIDRVDVNRDEGVAVAYDYKLSQGAKLDDIRSGRQVQIPIYLAALEELFLPSFDLGGGGYYTLRGKGARLNQGLYRLAFADCTNVTSSRTKMSDDVWQGIRREVEKRVWEFIDGMRGGHFKIKPSLGRHTCKFCDYSAVCRYDTYRIGRKKK